MHSHANSQAGSEAFLFSQQPMVTICSCPSAVVLLYSPSLLYFGGGGDQIEIQEYVNKHFSTELPCNPSPMVLIIFNICISPSFFFSGIFRRA